jgi:hypothetical protein
VIYVERQDWAHGYAAAKRYRHREDDLLMPYGYIEPDTQAPLGTTPIPRPSQDPSLPRTQQQP